MRVLQIVQKPQRRGAEIFAYDLSRRFEAQGLSVETLYLYGHQGEKALPLHQSDLCLQGAEHHPFERFPGLHPGLLSEVAQEIQRFRPDVVQVNGSRTVKYGAAARRLVSPKGRWKLVYRNIGMPSHWHASKSSLYVYRLAIIPQMDGVVSVSRLALEDANKTYELRVPSTVILNGIDTARLQGFQPRDEIRRRCGASPSDFVLLFLGSLETPKRPDRFVRVLSRVCSEDPRIYGWVVGDGCLRIETEGLARKLGIQDRTQFFGYQEDIASFIMGADLLVMTSDTEGVPAAVLEAGYLGRPVVATKVGGLPECVTDGETGVLIGGPFEDGLSTAILRLASNEVVRKAMGGKAREKIQRDFTIDSVAEKYLEFYERVSFGPRHVSV